VSTISVIHWLNNLAESALAGSLMNYTSPAYMLIKIRAYSEIIDCLLQSGADPDAKRYPEHPSYTTTIRESAEKWILAYTDTLNHHQDDQDQISVRHYLVQSIINVVRKVATAKAIDLTIDQCAKTIKLSNR